MANAQRDQTALISKMNDLEKLKQYLCPRYNFDPWACTECTSVKNCIAGQRAVVLLDRETSRTKSMISPDQWKHGDTDGIVTVSIDGMMAVLDRQKESLIAERISLENRICAIQEKLDEISRGQEALQTVRDMFSGSNDRKGGLSA